MKFKDVLTELPPHNKKVFVLIKHCEFPLVAMLDYSLGWIMLSYPSARLDLNQFYLPNSTPPVLKWHEIEIESNSDLVPCKVCGKEFTDSDELYNHYDKVHNKGEQE